MVNKKVVVLVDDEPGIVQALQRILELSGAYESITAANGEEALKKINRQVPDLIISDIAMPGMDGLEFCRRVRASEVTRNIPFVFLTAKKEMAVEGFKVGADDFIKKPFNFDEVMAKIEAIFRRIDSSREQASQVKGDLSEYDLDHILRICSAHSLSGSVILQHKGKIGEIELERGEITAVSFSDLSEDEALDQLRGWRQGIFLIRPQGIYLKPDFISDYKFDEQARLDEPVKIAENTWWVGWRNPNSLLQMNVYLRRFQKDKKSINFLIDPGSPLDFPHISQKIAKVIGNISKINLYSLNHPDPDVAMNAVFIRNANAKAVCLTTEENWRLIAHYEIPPESVKLIHTFKEGKAPLATGHILKFIPSPFCHAKGAFMIYDPQTRVLFTGDLFGGISDAERIFQFFAEEEEWDGIRAFHQIYMPTKRALRYVIEKIRALYPPPLIIAPQHGAILKGVILEQFMDRLFNLDVGADLLQSEEIQEWLKQYREAGNAFIDEAASFMTMEAIKRKLQHNNQIVSAAVLADGYIQQIFSRPEEVYEQLVLALIDGEEPGVANQLKSQALKLAHSRGLPAPHLDWENEQTITTTPPNLFEDK